MCGIAAIVSKGISSANLLKKMTDIIRHRGPDDEGFYLSDNDSNWKILGGEDTPSNVLNSEIPYTPQYNITQNADIKFRVGLGHRRLSILDLSPAGHNPISYDNNRYWMTYNGEVYNYIELREELRGKGYSFKTDTDTEVVMAAYAEWGTDCLHRFNGMWSFIIYDQEEDTIFATRDRFGIKPLYYWVSPDNDLCFASEIKQFTVLPGWDAKVNAQKAYDFLIYSLLDHSDETMFKGVYHVPPGGFFKAKVKETDIAPAKKIPITKWYELIPGKWEGSFEKATQEFSNLFNDSVKLRLRADVEVGSCLSGGLDSSSIVCTMNGILKERGANHLQKTFSACSHHDKYDERKWMDIVTSHTKVDANYVYPDFKSFMNTSAQLIWQQDEPYQSNSILFQWSVFKSAAENNITVMLDGQGADEQLAGYKGFFKARFSNLFKQLRFQRFFNEYNATSKIHGIGKKFIYNSIRNAVVPKRLLNKMRTEGITTPAWLNTDQLKCSTDHPYELINPGVSNVRDYSISNITSLNLQKLLHWEDRNSMAHSIEARVPFLDHRLVEFVISLPEQYKISDGITKRILRESMAGVLPDAICNRMDKIGFIAPEEIWVKNESTEVFRNKLFKAIENSRGIINEEILKDFDGMLEGEKPFKYTYWRIISFVEWMDAFSVSN